MNNKSSELGTNLAKFAYQKYPNLAKALALRSKKYNIERDEIFTLMDEGRIIVIMPNDTTGFKRTERNPERLTAIYNDGYKITLNMMGKIKDYLNA